jgi:hypothetical protein
MSQSHNTILNYFTPSSTTTHAAYIPTSNHTAASTRPSHYLPSYLTLPTAPQHWDELYSNFGLTHIHKHTNSFYSHHLDNIICINPYYVSRTPVLADMISNLIVCKSNIQAAGNGLYTMKSINKGVILGHYTGDELTTQQLLLRYPTHNCLYVFSPDDDIHIDAAGDTTSLFRFINTAPQHTCNIRINYNAEIITTRDIKSGEELYFHYGEHYDLRSLKYTHKHKNIYTRQHIQQPQQQQPQQHTYTHSLRTRSPYTFSYDESTSSFPLFS